MVIHQHLNRKDLMATTVTVTSHRKSTPRILRNVFSNWTCYAVILLVNFFLSPFVVHHLGNAGYGVWTLIVSLTGYLGLLDFGVRGAVTRYVAKFHTTEEDQDAGRVASSGMLIFSAAGLVAITIATGLAVFAVVHFRIPAEYQTAARIVLVLAGANIAASLVGGVFGGVVVALQRFDLLNGVDILGTALRALCIVIALRSGRGLITLACIQLAITVARGTANFIISHKLYPTLKLNFSNADRAHARLIFSFSVYMFLIQIGGDLIFYTDTVVIGAFLPVAMITFFMIAGNLLEYTRAMLTGISHTVSPFASQLEARGDQAGLQHTLLTSCRFGSAVVLPILITFMIRGGTFIGLWMGPQYVSLSGHVLRILALMTFFSAGTYQAGSIMLGISKHKPLVLVRIGEGLCNLALSIVLVKRMGIVGVAWGTTIPGIAFCLLFWPWYVQRTLDIHPLRYVVSTWVRPWLSLVPFALFTYATERTWPAPNLLVFFSQVALVIPVALAGIWFGCVEREYREKYFRSFTQSMVQVFSRS
jgi:O-antigen/teichoic acid export membrane protein